MPTIGIGVLFVAAYSEQDNGHPVGMSFYLRAISRGWALTSRRVILNVWYL